MEGRRVIATPPTHEWPAAKQNSKFGGNFGENAGFRQNKAWVKKWYTGIHEWPAAQQNSNFGGNFGKEKCINLISERYTLG